MMTLFASRSSSAVSAALIELDLARRLRAPGVLAAAPSPPPKPPAMTLMKLRFIARHMM